MSAHLCGHLDLRAAINVLYGIKCDPNCCIQWHIQCAREFQCDIEIHFEIEVEIEVEIEFEFRI